MGKRAEAVMDKETVAVPEKMRFFINYLIYNFNITAGAKKPKFEYVEDAEAKVKSESE